MSKRGVSYFEKSPERIPTEEEVRWLFEGSIGEATFTETQKLEDENGLYFWEVTVQEGGGQREYTYERKKQQGTEQGVDISATIYTTYYDDGGISSGGESIAKLVNGEWRVTPRGPFESTKLFV